MRISIYCMIHTIDEVDSSHDRIARCPDICEISSNLLLQAPYIDFHDDPRGRVPLDFPVWFFAIP